MSTKLTHSAQAIIEALQKANYLFATIDGTTEEPFIKPFTSSHVEQITSIADKFTGNVNDKPYMIPVTKEDLSLLIESQYVELYSSFVVKEGIRLLFGLALPY